VIVGSFKSAVSRKIHRLSGGEEIKVWQRNYFEHIIRDEGEYERIADYIHANPDNWEADRENWG
jgi:REP element-mobilizing transposase RayT